MKERDQHVAHRVNNREIGEAFALLAGSGPHRLLDVNVLAFRPSAPGRSRAKGLHELATAMHDMLQRIMDEMREEAAALVASTLDQAYANARPAEFNMHGELDHAWDLYLDQE